LGSSLFLSFGASVSTVPEELSFVVSEDLDSYTLEQLSEISGFDKRVIRSFIENGLMLGPASRGRYARYDENHLKRLKAIKYMREKQDMSFSDVRQALLTMNDEQISSVLEPRLRRFQGDRRTALLQYLDGLSTTSVSPVEKLSQALGDLVGPEKVRSQVRSESWHRISVTPDVELNIKNSGDLIQLAQWEAVAGILREILLGGSKNE
jgi:DNA-binding transcriptional MerR regulator